MYQTLLCAQLLNAENPHCLKAGALNDQYDEDEGGVVQANRLPTKYNALDFSAPSANQIIHSNGHATSIYEQQDAATISVNYNIGGGSQALHYSQQNQATAAFPAPPQQ